ncbi:unnamed protein product, partial [Heterotrigona itama]
DPTSVTMNQIFKYLKLMTLRTVMLFSHETNTLGLLFPRKKLA